MEKEIKKFNYETPIQVPAGVRFLSDWDEFNFSAFEPKCIINKEIPGCGMTEYCIGSPEPIVLCSPRKMLLENKFNQHKDEVYLVRNEMDKDTAVDKDLTKSSTTPKEPLHLCFSLNCTTSYSLIIIFLSFLEEWYNIEKAPKGFLYANCI